MIVKLGPLIAEARGAIGGAVAARNRSGAYFRNRTKPVDPGSAKQNQFRTRLSAGVVAWRALTEAQRVAFNDKALITDFVNSIGESIHPTGMNLFIRGHNLLDIAGIAQVTVPPITPIIDDSGSYISFHVVDGFEHHSTTAGWPTDAIMCCWYIYDLSPSLYYYKGPYVKFSKVAAGEYTADKVQLRNVEAMQQDMSMFCMWRLVATTGAASAPRRGRAFRP